MPSSVAIRDKVLLPFDLPFPIDAGQLILVPNLRELLREVLAGLLVRRSGRVRQQGSLAFANSSSLSDPFR
jgi:hypothetical protein